MWLEEGWRTQLGLDESSRCDEPWYDDMTFSSHGKLVSNDECRKIDTGWNKYLAFDKDHTPKKMMIYS